MSSFCTRAFCRNCRLHFEYALTETDLRGDVIVLCPRCYQPAKHGRFQPCDEACYERIEAQYERLARHVAEAKWDTKRSKGKRRYRLDEGDYDEDRDYRS